MLDRLLRWAVARPWLRRRLVAWVGVPERASARVDPARTFALEGDAKRAFGALVLAGAEAACVDCFIAGRQLDSLPLTAPELDALTAHLEHGSRQPLWMDPARGAYTPPLSIVDPLTGAKVPVRLAR